MAKSNKLREFFGLDGGEFMNTGMTLREWCMTRELKKIHDSYVTQDRREQKRRREFVIRIAVEGTRIREIDNFSSIVVESAVEHVMEGDWEAVARDIEWCTFRDVFHSPTTEVDDVLLAEHQERERYYRDLWKPFRELLEQALASKGAPPDKN